METRQEHLALIETGGIDFDRFEAHLFERFGDGHAGVLDGLDRGDVHVGLGDGRAEDGPLIA